MLAPPPLHLLNTADALTLITQFDTATDEHTIVALLCTLISQEMGFDHFRLGFIFPSSIQRPEVRIFNGCPAQWVQAYDAQRLFAVDPVVHKGMTQSRPILWADLITECCEQQEWR